ncbi:hypothetical protein MYCTH_2306708 [Thermothelomyces thermophilus ATCC 42464]|uniref:Uncharacterized protein n=1 Tax=Thermothelomyces thermophilus (strain ATCC 42464 / BCRC 31852 / DSM 1799) TaxID=573729 RepID=G2QHS5_THET4|nr:uncharacterized protein MYCTH_2306708 [Thermothelomyces thermophilus ATCC 42464]AEO58935.1 hypothetical protein MYCTH_2306708 [Thermothelomyces thermophilus ATCC 42464]
MHMASSSAPRPTTARILSKAESATGLMKTSNFPSTTTLDSGSGTSSTVSTPVAPPRESYPGLLPTWEAEQAIREFIDRHWSHRADYIKVDCWLTLPELRALGRLSREEGWLACRRLVRVPAIHEEVALSLWEHLAEEEEKEEEKEAEEEEEAGDAGPTAVVTVPSFSQMPLADPSAAGDARVVPGNNSSHEAAEARTRRRWPRPRQRRLRLRLRLKSLVTSLLLFPEARPPPPPPKPHTTPALNRKAAGNPHPCPFCSGDCTTSLAAAARQQQQQAHKPAFWRRENYASASPPPCPPPSPRLSGDTLTASRTGESAGRAEASASEKGDARSKPPRPVGPVFFLQPAPGLRLSLWKGQQRVGRERQRRASG